MSYVYLMINDGGKSEDHVIFLEEEEAIKTSIQYPNCRIEIFGKKSDSGKYLPTYN